MARNSPGHKQHRLTVLQPPTDTDAMGQVTGDWQTVTTLWGNVRDLTSNRLFAAQQVHAEARTEVRIDYLSAASVVTEGMRLQYTSLRGTRILEIVGIPADPDGMGRDLVCLCREVQP